MSGGSAPFAVIDPEIQDPELPPSNFDPLKNAADRKLLHAFRLPPCPDPQAEPALFAHWQALFSGGPLTYVTADSTRYSVDESAAVHGPHNQSRPAGGRANTAETSLNWSGAYVTAGCRDSLVQAGGSWTAPLPKPGSGPNPNHMQHRCSIWVGIDGHARWTTSMPQIGTEHTVDPETGLCRQRFWWQWWLGDGRATLPYALSLGLSPGDKVVCQVRMESDSQAVFHAKNDTTHTLTSVVVTGLAPIVGNSAEWIVERPSRPHVDHGVLQTGEQYPSPDFGAVGFEGLVARGVSPSDGSRTYTMRTARLITSFEIWRDPTRAVTIARPQRGSGGFDGLCVVYAAPRLTA